MKKIIAIVLLLSVLSVASFCMISGAVSEEKAMMLKALRYRERSLMQTVVRPTL